MRQVMKQASFRILLLHPLPYIPNPLSTVEQRGRGLDTHVLTTVQCPPFYRFLLLLLEGKGKRLQPSKLLT